MHYCKYALSEEDGGGSNDGAVVKQFFHEHFLLSVSCRSIPCFLQPLTLWVVADLDSEDGRQFAYNAIKHVKHSKKTRVC